LQAARRHAPLLLRSVDSARHIPISVEWTVPFYETAFHIGVHNIPSAQGIAWIRKAAAQGHVDAEQELGVVYATGDGVKQDDVQAVAWFRKAAEQGDALGQFNYAVVLTKGLGVEADVAQAVEWYRQAAQGGHYPSQARLGYCYAKGLGTGVDRIEAFVWLSAAAQHGVGLAMAELEEVVRAMSEDERMEGRRRLAQGLGSQGKTRLSA